MSIRNDITGLLGFIGRQGAWRERLQDVVADHLMPALEEFDLDQDDLAQLLGEQWSGVLWGCGFEDFLGRRYDDANIVDLYLKHRGGKESALDRAYLAALRDTPISLHEVSDVQPGTSMVLRDLLSDAEPVTVREKSATRSLKQWDRIAVRVTAERDYHVISGALLPFSAEASEFLFSGLRSALKLKNHEALRLARDELLGCAPIFTAAWLFTEIPRALTPVQPTFFNSDGDEVVFHDLRFPLAAGVTQKEVAVRLNEAGDFLPGGPKFWNWLAPRKQRAAKVTSGTMLETHMEGTTILGSLELKGNALLVTVNSAERAASVQALVTKAADDLLKRPLIMIRTVEQLRAEGHREQPHGDADDIPPDVARQITHEYMDKHYRETLNTPVPALGGKSPRQAVRSDAGRAKVIEWLKLLENRSALHDDGPIAGYDFGWMWAELGLQEHRK